MARCRKVTFVSNVCSVIIGANLAAVSITLSSADADAINIGMPTSAAKMFTTTRSTAMTAMHAQNGADLQHGAIVRQGRGGSGARKEDRSGCVRDRRNSTTLSEWSMSVSLSRLTYAETIHESARAKTAPPLNPL